MSKDVSLCNPLCFASIHFVTGGSLHLRNVFRSGVIPQDIFQHFTDSYLYLIDLKQNNLIEIDGKIFMLNSRR
jgi:hypothetical protein